MRLTVRPVHVRSHTHTFRRRFNTTLLSRFFLNLRQSVLSSDDHTLDRVSGSTETHFTSIVFGNIGGSLALGLGDELEVDASAANDDDDDEFKDVTEVERCLEVES